jgi:Trypsin
MSFLFGLPLDQYYVSFDPVYRFDASTLYRGTFVPNPDHVYDYPYAGTSARDPHDVAIVRLDTPAPATPATLPTAGLLSSLDLRQQRFTTVGYGRTRIDRTKGPNNIVTQFARNVTDQGFKNLFPAWLTLLGNTSTATNLTCFGDSGGPHFLGDSNLIVSLTATGAGPCNSTEVTYRMDTPSARQYLAAQGVPLP